jgi:hypothetical protein
MIDKNSDTDWSSSSCSHTDAGPEMGHGMAWWQVDLGGMARINEVHLWHRTDCCQDRLESAKIYVSQSDPIDPTTGAFNPQGAQLCGMLSDHTHAPEIAVCAAALGGQFAHGGQPVQGQFVTVAHERNSAAGAASGAEQGAITICEMEVMGSMSGRVQHTSLTQLRPAPTTDSTKPRCRDAVDGELCFEDTNWMLDHGLKVTPPHTARAPATSGARMTLATPAPVSR